MARRKSSKGTCTYCEKELAKSGMSKHLRSCKERKKAIEKANTKKAKPETLYHLRIQDAYSPDFWLDLEVRGSKKLQDIDNYLRSIWLECCGHLSEFSLDRFMNTIGMSRKIEDTFENYDQIMHIYDFGTSSETLLKCVDTREGKPLSTKPIVLMARNKQPEEICMDCKKPATYLCLECLYEDQPSCTLCDEHAETHPHDDYGEPMPLVNSPRVGMCGYDGPAEPPY